MSDTVRIFATEAEAERYDAEVFADLLIVAAERSDGTVERSDTGAKVSPAQIVDAKSTDTAALVSFVRRVPLYGRKADGRLSRTDGVSTRWAEPRQTAAGEWAIAAVPADKLAVPFAAIKWAAVESPVEVVKRLDSPA